MRTLTLWLMIAVTGLGGFAGAYHLYLENHPHRVLVVIDSSAAMAPDWLRLPALLDRLDDRPYTLFALATDKDMRHLWSRQLELSILRPNGERNLARLLSEDSHLRLEDTPERLLISNAPAAETAGLSAAGWRIIQL